MRFDLGKKGDSEEIAWPQVIFTILVLAFTVVFFIFAKNILSGAMIQEEIQAKKIALLLDSAEPGTVIQLDITELNKIAVKSGEKETSFADIVKLDGTNHTVTVSLRKGDSSYTHKYFSDYEVTSTVTSANGKILFAMEVK